MVNWTDERLVRLFEKYNRQYWRGRLPRYAVRSVKPVPWVGFCTPKNREIRVDISAHRSDRAVRDTLLHEMAHAAAPRGGHGDKFYAQIERLLGQGAPVSVGNPEAPYLKILTGTVPRRFPLARKTMNKAEAARERSLLREIKADHVHPQKITEDAVVQDFEDAALELTWKKALHAVGHENGLLDVAGNPKNRWAAQVIAKGKKAFMAMRRDHLADQKKCNKLPR